MRGEKEGKLALVWWAGKCFCHFMLACFSFLTQLPPSPKKRRLPTLVPILPHSVVLLAAYIELLRAVARGPLCAFVLLSSISAESLPPPLLALLGFTHHYSTFASFFLSDGRTDGRTNAM